MSLSGIFGGAGRKFKKFRPINIESGGITGTFNKVGKNQFDLSLSRGAGVDAALSSLTQGLEDRSSAFGSLRSRVSGAFGDLTRAKVQAIRDAGTRTVGNLRNRLRQRRVLGSSFAENQIAGTEALFAQEEERARAEGVVGEIGLSAELIDREFSGAIESAAAALDQFNFESSIAANLQTAGTSALLAVAQGRAQARQARDQGIGELVGTFAGLF